MKSVYGEGSTFMFSLNLGELINDDSGSTFNNTDQDDLRFKWFTDNNNKLEQIPNLPYLKSLEYNNEDNSLECFK